MNTHSVRRPYPFNAARGQEEHLERRRQLCFGIFRQLIHRHGIAQADAKQRGLSRRHKGAHVSLGNVTDIGQCSGEMKDERVGFAGQYSAGRVVRTRTTKSVSSSVVQGTTAVQRVAPLPSTQLSRAREQVLNGLPGALALHGTRLEHWHRPPAPPAIA